IILSNLFLVLVNSSDTDFVFRSISNLAKDKVMWAVALFTAAGLCAVLYTPLNSLLKLGALSSGQMMFCIAASLISVFWYELVKLAKYLRRKSK
ncbi:MAG: cation-translocating P-type ATPase, partial [Clostridiales bacterium]|nr:cation-translocating P-type ATPase [Clostridiales bacterium]